MVMRMQRLGLFLVVMHMWTGLPGCSGGGDSPPSPQASPPPPATINDPLFADQWHLKNTGQGGGTAGEDVNVEPVWNRGLLGQGIRIHVVDDGLEQEHEDLTTNVLAGNGWNYFHPDNGCQPPTCTPNGLGPTDPSPTDLSPTGPNNHGTAVAGVAGASGNNVGGRGAAPRASLVGYNLIGGNVQPLSDSFDKAAAEAMTRDAKDVHINTNSWGYKNNRGFLIDSGPRWKAAVQSGVEVGRGGRGTIYLFAAGNEGDIQGLGDPQNSNYDGYARNRHVMAICAVDARGKKATYSQSGANLWVCAPSNAGGSVALPAITTTDRMGTVGYANGNYTNSFGGTSSATPLAAGITALVLQANPNLGWRDVRLILAETARKNDPTDPDWQDMGINTVGGKYHHNQKYGFGVVNADAAVQRAATWTNVGPQKPPVVKIGTPNVAIPGLNPAGVTDTITVSNSGISSIEFIEITFTSDHSAPGDLIITLTHEDTATKSPLSERRLCGQLILENCGGYTNGWTFGSARHLGEVADGTWTLNVVDRGLFNHLLTGKTFQSWQLTFYGR